MPEGGEAEVVEAVLVLRAGLEHGDLRRVDESPVVVRDLTEVAGDVVGQAEVALPAVVAGVVPVEPMEVLTPRVGLEHGARAQRQARADLHVLELLDPLRERGVEHVRLREAGAVLHPVAGGHERAAAGRPWGRTSPSARSPSAGAQTTVAVATRRFRYCAQRAVGDRNSRRLLRKGGGRVARGAGCAGERSARSAAAA